MTREHVHGRSYWGEADGRIVAQWLNRPTRPAGDAVERLISLDAQLPRMTAKLEPVEREIQRVFGDLVRRSRLALAPTLKHVEPGRWELGWGLVGNMSPPQALAFVALGRVAEKGLLRRIRQCRNERCGRWFFARFGHVRFCSARCRERTFQADPGWRAYRADYMRQHRAEKKFQRSKKTRSSRKGKR
jgi:hypothetical protein